MNTIPI